MSSETTPQLCVFRVGGEQYAIDIARIEEILPSRPLTPLPRAPGYLEGVLHLRGGILAAVDVRRQLGVEPSVPAGREKVLICRVGRTRVALIVDAVTRIVRVPLSELKPAPPLPDGGCVLGAFGAPGALTLLFDVKALFAAGAPGAARGA
jgi:purine-binding chemotaxis protein CheW